MWVIPIIVVYLIISAAEGISQHLDVVLIVVAGIWAIILAGKALGLVGEVVSEREWPRWEERMRFRRAKRELRAARAEAHAALRREIRQDRYR